KIDFGEYVRAGDRFEVLKPPYAVVKQQDSAARGKLNIVGAQLFGSNTLLLTTDPHPQAVIYALTIPGVRALGEPASAGWPVDIDYNLVDPLWAADSEKPSVQKQLAAGLKVNRSGLPAPPERNYPYINSAMEEKPFQFAGGDFERGKSLFFGE